MKRKADELKAENKFLRKQNKRIKEFQSQIEEVVELKEKTGYSFVDRSKGVCMKNLVLLMKIRQENSYSVITIPILSTYQAIALLMQVSTLLTKKGAEIRDVVRKDSVYGFLKKSWIDETRKNISTLLEGPLACNKRASLHGECKSLIFN
ncbi:13212_t:CDS:2 [Cetraspora pellucida]|uniref:13212_t:CDS:1 n=1 Tax=Cetraspora pellucida TaxID=1433469 RepID=A0A9N9HIL3_9GLOM|nr:13212_t:CDS:2 [Cetraspora pellucida]